MNQRELLSNLSTIKKELIMNYGIKDIALFGSYVHGNQREDSDIDLVVFTDKKNYFKLIEMENYISRVLNKKVDLGFYDGMSSFMKNEIRKDLIYV